MEPQAALRETLELILGCEPGVAEALLACGRVQAAARRDCIARQGDLLGTMWLVIEGELKIESAASSGRTSRLALCGPGDWLGSYARPTVYLADIVAIEPARLLAFPSGELPRLAAGHPLLGGALALSFARQLENTIARLDARSTLSSRGRIHAELLQRAGDGLEIAPPPVVAELAMTAQTTRETASRAIAELERRGIITRTARSLRINSPRLLADLVV
ncbi:Crp/Fnr family transcriptional regulator [Sphingomonas canadensis]|uniref:Crp/Fnr family transcriptional regulator n=1 Tax=Sphingomonas canadensis TaxID=1219257 RepID=A0ABW3H5N0_9SPHN|nr:Crp/Fnr family transcriptional regulator [Sphingomonas canadensis]MCW3836157.1 Crp/Fnr family transcriptional regulator [Sphingomonas canadensis]